jgi:hypothetical protein
MAKRRRYIDGDVLEAIQQLALDQPEWPAALIQRELDKNLKFCDRLPTLRTFQMIVKEARPPDPSGPWSLADAEAGDVALVLPVLAAVVAKTQGSRQHITRAEAEWLVKLRGAYPDLDPWLAYRLARLYMARVDRREATVDLDLYLAAAPWRGGEAEAQYRRLWADGVIPAPHMLILSQNVIVGVPPEEMAEHELFQDNLMDRPEVARALEEQRREIRRIEKAQREEANRGKD